MREIIVDKCVSSIPRENGRFIPGYSYSPKTQIKTGERRSPSTEFKKGERRSQKTESGLLRAWIKIDEPNIWKKRAVLVWESLNGPLPKGFVVHHVDRDSLNDDINNLLCLSHRDHAEEHREELNTWKNYVK